MSNVTSLLIESRQFAWGYIDAALYEYHVDKYATALYTRVNDICMEIGLTIENRSKFVELRDKLIYEICMITRDESERDRLLKYAEKIIAVGRVYMIFYHRN